MFLTLHERPCPPLGPSGQPLLQRGKQTQTLNLSKHNQLGLQTVARLKINHGEQDGKANKIKKEKYALSSSSAVSLNGSTAYNIWSKTRFE